MPLILGTNSIKDTGFDVTNSCRFNDGSSDSLTKTFSGDGTSHDIGTVSVWLKRGELSAEQGIFTAGSSNRNFIRIESGGQLTFRSVADSFHLQTNQVFRDPSAWSHIVIAFDTTQGTASNRVKFYHNGSQITSFGTETYPSQNQDIKLGAGELNAIGKDSEQTNPLYDGYMAEFVYIDGQQLAPTSFGEFDEDSPTIWKPKDVSGLTFGTNGFYLDFENASSLGADASGNGNNFTVNNLTSIDQSTDTCTNNFATWNPLDNFYGGASFSEGNLYLTSGASNESFNLSTIGISQGKWYFEVKTVDVNGNNYVGVSHSSPDATTDWLGNNSYSWGYRSDGTVLNSASSVGGTWSSYTDNDIIGVALDLDNNKLYFSKNGTWQNSGNPTSGSTGTGAVSITDPSNTTSGFYFFGAGDKESSSSQFSANFGSPAFSISSGNSDGNGYGNFEYSVPSGYYALNTKNLAEFG